ncbi:hypothetical protein RchiOBHm_Chr1g0352381 [Rosa chinensis]|uniref:Uncharacterized protein n=1 Tax=Rosa chinensis TaxID=74649 RepID=A0A2P6SGK3_ROSCH|nr:hypothetical protein RchiOBHm_Chr1g0352381 [Rosa chinensis]
MITCLKGDPEDQGLPKYTSLFNCIAGICLMFTGSSFFLWAKRKGRFPRLFMTLQRNLIERGIFIVRRMLEGMKSLHECCIIYPAGIPL